LADNNRQLIALTSSKFLDKINHMVELGKDIIKEDSLRGLDTGGRRSPRPYQTGIGSLIDFSDILPPFPYYNNLDEVIRAAIGLEEKFQRGLVSDILNGTAE